MDGNALVFGATVTLLISLGFFLSFSSRKPRRKNIVQKSSNDEEDTHKTYVISVSLYRDTRLLTFESAVAFRHSAPNDSSFVAEQNGRIFHVTSGRKTIAMDLSHWIVPLQKSMDERGLHDFVLHPQYRRNRLAYVSLSATKPRHQAALPSQHFDSIPEDADHYEQLLLVKQRRDATFSLVKILFSFPHPSAIHQGGGLAFDHDGNLFWAVGDGGPQGDPENHAQNMRLPQGKLLRMDRHGHICIAVAGLRNPWRISYDTARNALYVGDVGWDSREVVYVFPLSKKNELQLAGWPALEGTLVHRPKEAALLQKNPHFVGPIYEYKHNGKVPTAIIGGYIDPQTHAYVFGDINGTLRAILQRGDNNEFILVAKRSVRLPSKNAQPFFIKSMACTNSNILALVSHSSSPVNDHSQIYEIHLKKK